jgi:hypothetical protein
MNSFLITGMAKSGTTWVQRICRAHPEMHCRAEDQFTKFWSRINDTVTEYNELIDLRDRQRDEQGVEPLDRGDSIRLFYSMVQITLDKAPPHVAWSGIKDLTLSARGFLKFLPNPRVINVIRDPRDTAISAHAHGRRIGEDNDGKSRDMNETFLSETAHHWLKQLALAEAARGEFPNRTHDIRYEDLIENFSPTVEALLKFFDVDRSAETIEALRSETDFKRLSGGRSPGDQDDTSYFRKGLAGDWRSTLTGSQIALVDEICGDQLQAMGYDRK